MTNDERTMNYLLNAIEAIVDSKIQNLSFDKTYIGVVRSVINENTFKIEYDGAIRKFVTKNTPNITTGSTVHIVHPSNNINARFLLEDIKRPN